LNLDDYVVINDYLVL